ncbi:MAG: hypothetical protein ACLUVG_19470 [Phocaeicola vulgatus]
MIVPSFRLYHFAVKLIWKRMLALTLLFWLGVAGVYYAVNEMPVWQEYGWWLPLMVGGTYFLIYGRKVDADDDDTRRRRSGSGIG